jgi:hypothetical protein
MDSECRRALSLNRNAFYVMARELEEDIFSPPSNHATSHSRIHHHSASHSPYALHPPTNSHASSPFSSMSSVSSLHSQRNGLELLNNIHSYRMSKKYVQSALSQLQQDFLTSVREQKEAVLKTASSSDASARKRLGIRSFCKVPWRCNPSLGVCYDVFLNSNCDM